MNSTGTGGSGLFRVGLTGGIGSGKSTLAKELARLGAELIDLDELSRSVLHVDDAAIAEAVGHFGSAITDADGTIDRKALAAIVFADASELEVLEHIVLGRVWAQVGEIESRIADGSIVIHDSPLLVEKAQGAAYDLVVVVQAPRELRYERLAASRGMTRTEIRARIDAQASDTERARAADVVVVNSGTESELKAEACALMGKFRENVGARP